MLSAHQPALARCRRAPRCQPMLTAPALHTAAALPMLTPHCGAQRAAGQPHRGLAHGHIQRARGCRKTFTWCTWGTRPGWCGAGDGGDDQPHRSRAHHPRLHRFVNDAQRRVPPHHICAQPKPRQDWLPTGPQRAQRLHLRLASQRREPPRPTAAAPQGNWPLLAASAPPYGAQNQVPRAMTRADMDALTAAFVASARRDIAARALTGWSCTQRTATCCRALSAR